MNTCTLTARFSIALLASGLILTLGSVPSRACAEAILIASPPGVQASSAFDAFFDEANLFDGAITLADIGTTNNLGEQYAGYRVGPHTVLMDYRNSITADSFVYSQRLGLVPSMDKVTQIEFWFETTDPGGPTVPARPADETVLMSNTTDPNLTRETFTGGPFTSRYVVMRLTGNNGNPGGSEFRFSRGDPLTPSYYTTIPLTVDEANTTDTDWGGSKPALVNDTFPYHPDYPTSNPPDQRWPDPLYHSVSSGGIVDLDFDAVHDEIVLDIWGRINYAGTEESRHQYLTITFYNGPTQTHQVTGWDGVSAKGDDPASYGRYIPPANVLADRVTIEKWGDFFVLAEVRAAAAPEPSTLALTALGMLGLWGRRRPRRRINSQQPTRNVQ